MADLLTQAQRDRIKGAINDVLDTFAQVPVTWWAFDKTPDRWQEKKDGPDSRISLTAFVEEQDTDTQSDQWGTGHHDEVRFMFKFDALAADGHIDSDGNPRISAEQDEIEYKGERYTIDDVWKDGLVGSDHTIVFVLVHKRSGKA